MVLAQDHGTEVPVVPRQDPGIADRSHRHDRQVGHIDSRVDVLIGEVKSEPQFRVCWCVEPVDTIEEGSSECDGRRGVPSGAQQQIDLSEHGPRDHDVTGGAGQQLGSELMASALASRRTPLSSDPDAAMRHARARVVGLAAGVVWIVMGWLLRVPIWTWLNAAPDCCLPAHLAFWLAMLTAPFVGAIGYFIAR